MEVKLWEHQQKAVELARIKANLALLFDTGTGKTGTMITILREEYLKHKQIIPTLIFAPVSVCPQWKKEFARFSNIPEDRILVLQGSGKKRTDALVKMMRVQPFSIVITNYEAVQNEPFYAVLRLWGPHILVCDEGHRLKDSTSVRAKKIFPIAQNSKRRFILTGTLITNSMMDVFGPFKIIDAAIFGVNEFKFKLKHFYDKNASMPKHIRFPDWQPRPGTSAVLGATIDAHAVQAKKEQCIDLPPLLEPTVHVDLSPKQRKLYDAMEQHFVASLGEQVTIAEFAMTKTVRLRQIVAGFIMPDDSDEATEIDDNPRLEALRDLLDSLRGQKVIVWTEFRATYPQIEAVCKKLNRSSTFITGDQSPGQKQKAVEDFCNGETEVLIANAAAGGAGLNLTEAKVSIHYTTGYSLEHFIQSKGRNYRGGSTMHDKVIQYHFSARDTIDEVINFALKNKQNVADTVLSWASKIRLDSSYPNTYIEVERKLDICQSQ